MSPALKNMLRYADAMVKRISMPASPKVPGLPNGPKGRVRKTTDIRACLDNVLQAFHERMQPGMFIGAIIHAG